MTRLSSARKSVLVLSRYGAAGASSRVRFLEWFPVLETSGFDFTFEPLLNDDYIRELYIGKRQSLGPIMAAYVRRLRALLKKRTFDLLWLEKEALPWIPIMDLWMLRRIGCPIVVDIDDAVFHNYDSHRSLLVRMMLGRKIDRIFALADLVLAGNSYLAGRAKLAGARQVEVLPTVVDTDRYVPRRRRGTGDKFRIGWIGSPSTDQYLAPLAKPLNRLTADESCEVVLIGARTDRCDDLRAIALPWSDDTEVANLQTFDVGIMPLPDDPWARGKCAFKLIQYMACGLPTVASPVGANNDIVLDGVTGFLAESEGDWFQVLKHLKESAALRSTMGQAGRARVETFYSRSAVSADLLRYLTNVLRS